MKPVGLLVAVAIALAAVPVVAWARKRPAAKIFPYVVPDAYFDHGASRDVARPLGHGLSVTLVFDERSAVRGVTLDDLKQQGLSVDQAHAVALRNLESLAKAREIRLAAFQGPAGRPFVLVGGSWAAATAVLLPGLGALVAEPLGTQEICASIPHREAMILFAKADRAYRDAMRALVREKESDGRKPLTFELFELTAAGPVPFVER